MHGTGTLLVQAVDDVKTEQNDWSTAGANKHSIRNATREHNEQRPNLQYLHHLARVALRRMAQNNLIGSDRPYKERQLKRND